VKALLIEELTRKLESEFSRMSKTRDGKAHSAPASIEERTSLLKAHVVGATSADGGTAVVGHVEYFAERQSAEMARYGEGPAMHVLDGRQQILPDLSFRLSLGPQIACMRDDPGYFRVLVSGCLSLHDVLAVKDSCLVRGRAPCACDSYDVQSCFARNVLEHVTREVTDVAACNLNVNARDHVRREVSGCSARSHCVLTAVEVRAGWPQLVSWQRWVSHDKATAGHIVPNGTSSPFQRETGTADDTTSLAESMSPEPECCPLPATWYS
jgi:hypothetical protein